MLGYPLLKTTISKKLLLIILHSFNEAVSPKEQHLVQGTVTCS